MYRSRETSIHFVPTQFYFLDPSETKELGHINKLLHQKSASSIGIQSLKIRHDSTTGAVLKATNETNGHTSTIQYRKVGIITKGRMTPNSSLKNIEYNKGISAITILISR